MHVPVSPSTSTAPASAGSPPHADFEASSCTANALPGIPERSPNAPVAIATWFGFVSATMIERDSL